MIAKDSLENKSVLGVNVIIKKSEFPNTSPVSLYILKASSPSITRASEDASNLKSFRPIEVDKKIELLDKYPKMEIEIQGHSDNDGSKEYNITLSQERAENVKYVIVNRGIEESRITAVGYGPDMPKFPNDTKENKAKNRRIDFLRKK